MHSKLFQILLVEDNDADVYLVRKALEHAGLSFELTVMSDGPAAIARIRDAASAAKQLPDVAIVDLNLPRNGGTEVIEAMRGTGPFTSVPVIVVSSLWTPSQRAKLEEHRVAHFFTKPPNLDEFLQIGDVVSDVLSNPKAMGGAHPVGGAA